MPVSEGTEQSGVSGGSFGDGSATGAHHGRKAQAACTDFESCTASYQPIRIRPIYVNLDGSGTGMNSYKANFVTQRLMPTVAAEWGRLLSVERVQGPLYAARDCVEYNPTSPTRCTSFDADTQCGYSDGSLNDDVLISFNALNSPFSYMLGAQTVWRGSTPTALPAGTGVANADFTIFVTARQTRDCPAATATSGTLAYAQSCQRDQFDRPTFGRINFCPWALPSSDAEANAEWNFTFSVAMHEATHALGFTSDSWPLFRNWDARRSPKTARESASAFGSPVARSNSFTRSCSGFTYAQTYADQNTVAYFAERGMPKCTAEQAATAGTQNCVAKHVGPRSVAAVRDHFNCPTLNGAELESSMTTGCDLQGSHWKQRIFNTELMASFVQPTATLSAVTLALLEDSGWYKANYNGASMMRSGWKPGLDWGYRQGCEFAMDKCLTVNSDGTFRSPGAQTHFFGDSRSNVCTLDRRGVGLVQILQNGVTIPTQFQYFPASPRQGGSDWIDFCPFIAMYSNRDCMDPATTTSNMQNAHIYGYNSGPRSACFESTLVRSDFNNAPAPGCYEYTCSGVFPGSTRVVLTVIARTTATNPSIPTTVRINCTQGDAGKVIGASSVAWYRGGITCPDVQSFCAGADPLIPSFVPRTQARFTLAGISTQTALAAGLTFTTAARNGVAALLTVPTSAVTITSVGSARLLMGEVDGSQEGALIARELQSGSASTTVGFIVTANDTASAATIARRVNTTLGGVPNSLVIAPLLQPIAIAMGVSQSSLNATVVAGSVTTEVRPTSTTPSTPSGGGGGGGGGTGGSGGTTSTPAASLSMGTILGVGVALGILVLIVGGSWAVYRNCLAPKPGPVQAAGPGVYGPHIIQGIPAAAPGAPGMQVGGQWYAQPMANPGYAGTPYSNQATYAPTPGAYSQASQGTAYTQGYGPAGVPVQYAPQAVPYNPGFAPPTLYTGAGQAGYAVARGDFGGYAVRR